MRVRFGVIGGDQRQAELVRLLRDDGYETMASGLGFWLGEELPLKETAKADVVILPLPLCRETGYLNCRGERVPAEEVFALLRPEQLVLAGQVKQEEWTAAESAGLQLVDYFLREEFAVANAAATAEAAIQVAMEQLDRTLWGSSCLVLGFGRIGKLLACRLQGMGTEVTVAARSPEAKAWIRAYGYKAIDITGMKDLLERYHVIFNTIPAKVLGASEVSCLRKDCLCIDLASVPGFDQSALEQTKRPHIWARFFAGTHGAKDCGGNHSGYYL